MAPVIPRVLCEITGAFLCPPNVIRNPRVNHAVVGMMVQGTSVWRVGGSGLISPARTTKPSVSFRVFPWF